MGFEFETRYSIANLVHSACDSMCQPLLPGSDLILMTSSWQAALLQSSEFSARPDTQCSVSGCASKESVCTCTRWGSALRDLKRCHFVSHLHVVLHYINYITLHSLILFLASSLRFLVQPLAQPMLGLTEARCFRQLPYRSLQKAKQRVPVAKC